MRQGLAMLALGLALTGAAAASGAGTAPATVYTDRTGDAASAADISRVTVTDSDGLLRFDVEFAPRQDLTGTNVTIFFDTDGNVSTGDVGADDAVAAAAGSSDGRILSWDGENWQQDGALPASVEWRSDAVQISFARSQLELGDEFDFAVASTRGPWPADDADTLRDGDGFSRFTVSAPQAPPSTSIKQVAFRAGLGRVKAGSLYSIGPVQLVLDDGTRIEPDSLRCRLMLAKRALRSLASCRFQIPKRARGRTLQLTLTATHGDLTRSQQMLVRVR